MLSLDHRLVGKGGHKTPCTLPFLQAQGSSLASLPLVTFQSFPLLAMCIIPKMYSCTLYRGAERDASYITFLDPKSDYVLNTNMGKQVERGQSIE